VVSQGVFREAELRAAGLQPLCDALTEEDFSAARVGNGTPLLDRLDRRRTDDDKAARDDGPASDVQPA